MKNNIKEQIINELYKPARKNFPRRAVEIRGLDDQFSADLADFQNFARENKGNRYILLVINNASKFLYAEPLQNKKGKTTAEALEKIFQRAREIPRNFCTDFGGEFENSHVQRLLKEYNIKHFHVYSEKKAAIAERSVKTLKIALYKNFQIQGSRDWISHLDRIVERINKTIHKAIGMKPWDVKKKHEAAIIARLKKRPIIKQKKIAEGEFVRISKYKEMFKRGYDINWSPEIYRVVKRLDSNPPVYYVNDLKNEPVIGAFYFFELLPTKIVDFFLVEKVLKRDKGKALVR